MIYSKVIIVGGGPAGSTCAWKLKQYGVDCLILDKHVFPRSKLCAGWITPQVLDDLQISARDYPHSFTEFNDFQVHIRSKEVKLKVHQYAIRRREFDDWLLKRAGVLFNTHEVKSIRRDGQDFIIDDSYRCHYLVGAGGTHCPVYHTFFRTSKLRQRKSLIITIEEEFSYRYQDGNCHLWFLQNKLPGYSWYVPKKNGYVNIGIGGFAYKLKENNDHIKRQWLLFIRELERLSLIRNHQYNPKGYAYYIRDSVQLMQDNHIALIGDAAGLATKDMGEGIGPAIQSGILAADAIHTGKKLCLKSVKKNSFPKYRTYAKLLMNYFLT